MGISIRTQIAGILIVVSACAERAGQTIDCTPATEQQLRSSQPGKVRWSHDNYAAQLELKKQQVAIALKSVSPGQKILHEPTLVMPAFGGTLLSFNHGEWGGELVYRDPGGALEILVHDNIVDIYRMPFGYVAFASLRHGLGENGKLYRILDSGRKVRVDSPQILPGMLLSQQLLREGGILLQVEELELPKRARRTLVLRDSGSLQQVSCG